MQNLKETDLFLPIKDYFIKNGYTVDAEVKNCDVVCKKDDDLIIIELKKSFNMQLLYQALERKRIANYVFVAIKAPKSFKNKNVKNMISLLKTLNIGLITISFNKFANVQVVLTPNFTKVNSKKRKSIFKELNDRNIQANIGGSSTKNANILTAYKEKTIFIACALKKLKKASAKDIKNLTNIEDCYNILYKNYNGYFLKTKERGIYTLSEKGLNMLLQKDLKDVIDFYENEVNKSC